MTSVHISDIAAWCNIEFGSNPLSYAHHLYLNGEEVKDLVIPNSVTSIGGSTFSNCFGLTSVTIPNSVTSIGRWAFSGCSGLTSVTIGNSVESIEDRAFSDCSGLTSVTIPNSVTSIGGSAFDGCKGLTSVTIGKSVESIGRYTFAFCPDLPNVYCYAEMVPSTKSDAFDGSYPKYATLHVPAGSIESYRTTEPWSSFGKIVAISTEVDGINYDFDADTKQATVIAKSSGKYSGEVVIPESVEHGGTAYSVTSIGDYAFEYCYDLTSVTIPNSVTSIGEWAFFDCDGLTSVTIPYSVTSIGSKAFYSCSGLTSITIPNSVESIGNGAFSWCSGLASIVVEDGNPVYDSRNNCNAIIETATNTLHSGCKTTTIPNIVTSIGYGAFEGCIDLTSVTIPNSVTSIGEWAFGSCSGLTSVTIPNSVESIGYEAFSLCSGLTSITIPNSVTYIANSAFRSCEVLASIVVDEGNPYYDSRNNCNAIIETATNDLIVGCKSTEIPNSVESIGTWAFTDCFGLTSITIPNSVTYIGFMAFSGCSGLTSITIPNSVTSLGYRAFGDCSDLTSVTIGSGVTSIGAKAFVNCPELLDVYCYAENVPSTERDAFDGSYPKNPTLHVPAASIDSYKATEPWRSFGNIVAISESTSDLVIKDGESFENTEERELGTLTYTRNLPNLYWNPLYVPFKIPYEALKDNYDVAYINSMHSYDNDQNGEIDKMTMEVIKIKKGVLKANHPYLIRAKNEAAKQMDLLLEDVTLYPTVSNKLDCSSVYTHFEITGTYKRMTRGELGGSLVITTDGAWKKLAASSELKPFRFYLTITDREGSPLEVSEDAKSRINICVQGEDDFATGIDEMKSENANVKTAVYDLSGCRVQKAQKGIFIQNGKLMVK